MNEFLPMTAQEMQARGWDAPDFVLVSGDAYVDHSSFGAAIIGRLLEGAGYKVCVLAQPGWHTGDDFTRFGKPRLGFLVTAGNLDSMVSHYTAAKKRRSEDAYTPGGEGGKRPDRACIVYANAIRRAYRDTTIILGGIEASLRRFAHYDYWDDKVRHSLLTDAGADLLLYGMAERSLLAAAKALESGEFAQQKQSLLGAVFYSATLDGLKALEMPSLSEVRTDKHAYNAAFMMQQEENDPVRGRRIAQKEEKGYVVANPPPSPLSVEEMDAVYALPYQRAAHPGYDKSVPALEEVLFSLTSNRGCFGGCSFCALTYHQGRMLQIRSHQSLIQEAQTMIGDARFKGYIHDVGGPTANFRRPSCEQQLKRGVCRDKQCLVPPCKHLVVQHRDYLLLLRKLRALPGVKKVFVRSGLRFDYVMLDRDKTFLEELLIHHVSGQLRVAPEHTSPRVLALMGKAEDTVYERFCQRFEAIKQNNKLDLYLVPYFISSHPGSTLEAAIELACELKKTGQRPEQVQDFYPTPGTLSTAMYYTGMDPRNGEEVYVPKGAQEKGMQRALLQFFLPKNAPMVRAALRAADREELIGSGAKCLVPAQGRPPEHRAAAPKAGMRPPQGKPGERGKKIKGKTEAPAKAGRGAGKTEKARPTGKSAAPASRAGKEAGNAHRGRPAQPGKAGPKAAAQDRSSKAGKHPTRPTGKRLKG